MGIPVALRRKIFKRDSYTCQYCGWWPKTGDDRYISWGWASRRVTLDIDHMWPRAKGGLDWESNLVTACYWCNIRKGAKLLEPPVAWCMYCGHSFRDLKSAGDYSFDEMGVLFRCFRCIASEEEEMRKERSLGLEIDEHDHILVELRYYDSLIAAGADMG